jgi:hypothetical protein
MKIWNCFKKNQVLGYAPKYEIVCDLNGFIKNVTDDVLSILLYDPDALTDKFIGVIMSPFMSYIHATVLLPKYKSASKFERNLMHIYLNAKTTKRPLIIYTLLKQPIYVKISVNVINDPDNNTFFKLKFVVVTDFNNSNVSLSSALNPKLFTVFRKTKNNIIFANIEYKNSSKYITEYNEAKEIELYNRFQDDIINIIKSHFYPYIYIYEMTNHGCVIVSNVCHTYNMPRFCASLIVCFLKNVYMTTIDYSTIKAGISYDKVYIGATTNDQIMLLGNAYDDARYHCEICNPYEVCVSHEFVYKLKQENIYDNKAMYSRKNYNDDCVKLSKQNFIDLSQIDNKILYEHTQDKISTPRVDKYDEMRTQNLIGGANSKIF